MTSENTEQRYRVYENSELLEDRHRATTSRAEGGGMELTFVPLRCEDENGDLVDSGFTKVEVTQLHKVI